MRQRDIVRLRHNDEVVVRGAIDRDAWYRGVVLGIPYRPPAEAGYPVPPYVVDVLVGVWTRYRCPSQDLKFGFKKPPRRIITLADWERLPHSKPV